DLDPRLVAIRVLICLSGVFATLRSRLVHKRRPSREQGVRMEPPIQPLVQAPTQPIAPVAGAPVETRPNGLRRAILTAAISGLLLVAGGVAVVSAASPEPSASPSTVAPGGTTTPPSNGTTTPPTHSGTKADCPNMGGGTGGSGGSSTTPSTTPSTAPTPAT